MRCRGACTQRTLTEPGRYRAPRHSTDRGSDVSTVARDGVHRGGRSRRRRQPPPPRGRGSCRTSSTSSSSTRRTTASTTSTAAGRASTGCADADAAHTTQVNQAGTPYSCLLQNDVNLTSPPLPATCTDTTRRRRSTSHFANAPFTIDDYIPPTATTCPAPGRVRAQRRARTAPGLPGGCTRDLVHRYYQEQYQLDGGKQDRYVTGSDAVGLTMGYYDTTRAADLQVPAPPRPPGLRDRRRLLPGRVRRLVPQPPVADRGGDADLVRDALERRRRRRPALGGRRQRDADQLPALHRRRPARRSRTAR